MRNDKIYGVGDDIIGLGSIGKCPYPPGLLDWIGLAGESVEN